MNDDLGIRSVIVFAIAMLAFAVVTLVIVAAMEQRATIRHVENLNRGGGL
jgi:hypothetical protein